MSEEKRVKCKMCKEPIHDRSKICTYCNSYQNNFHRFIKTYETLIVIVVSIFAVYISFDQLKEAQKERVSAENANNVASTALGKVKNAEEIINTLSSDNNRISQKIDSTYNNFLSLENILGKELDYRIATMSRSESGSYFILLDKNNLFSSIQHSIKQHFFAKQFLSNYSFNYSVVMSKNPSSLIADPYKRYFDIFILSFFEWYYDLYLGNWYKTDVNIGTWGASGSLPKVDSAVIKSDKIITEVGDNSVIEYLKNKFERCRLYLPPNTRMNINKRNYISPIDKNEFSYDRTITFENEVFAFTIDINCYKAIDLDNKYLIQDLGLVDLVKPDDGVKAVEFNLFSKVEFKKNYKFNRDTAKQFYWCNQFLESIKKAFTW